VAATGSGADHLPEPERAAVVAFSAEMTVPLLGISLAIAVFTSVFLVSSAVGFALDARQRELGLLRLLGASPRQVAVVCRVEAAVLGAVGGLIGAALGAAGSQVVRSALVASTLADPLLRVPVPVWTAAVTVGGAVLTAVAGAWGPSRRAGRTEPVAALALPGGARRAMTPARWVLGLGALAGAAAGLLVPADPGEDGPVVLCLLTSMLMIVGCSALAPLLVPAAARGLAAVVRRIAPGTGLLAGADARLHARRTAALAAPLLLVVGLYAGTGTLSTTARSVPSPGPATPLPASLVVEGAAASRRAACADVPGVAICAPTAPLPGTWTAGDESGAGDGLVVDPATAGVLGLVADSGDLAQIADDVAGLGAYVAGAPTLHYTDAAGVRHDLAVGPVVVDDGPHHADWGPVLSFAQLDAWGAPEVADVTLWVTVRPGADVAAVGADLAAVVGGDVSTVPQWQADRDAQDEAQNRAALLALFGAAELLALTGVAVTCASSARDRRAQTALLRRTGASGRQVLGAALLEVLLVAAVAVLLLAVVQAVLIVRIGVLLPEAVVTTPWRDLGALLAAGVGVAVLATGVATWREVRRAAAGAGQAGVS
jgi:putative ABC transport system permease protein